MGQPLEEPQSPYDGDIRQLEPPAKLPKEVAVPHHLLAQTLVAAVEEIAVKLPQPRRLAVQLLLQLPHAENTTLVV